MRRDAGQLRDSLDVFGRNTTFEPSANRGLGNVAGFGNFLLPDAGLTHPLFEFVDHAPQITISNCRMQAFYDPKSYAIKSYLIG